MDHRLSKYTYKISKYSGQHGGALGGNEVIELKQLLTVNGYSIEDQELFLSMTQLCLTKIQPQQQVVSLYRDYYTDLHYW
jgi:hypothetical protein